MDFHGIDLPKNLRKMRELKPDMFKSFVEFDRTVFQDAALTGKIKELMAVTAAHVTQCPWCIDVHTTRAKEKGATDEEITEAVFVAMTMAAGAAWAHGGIAIESAAQHSHK
ncbi:MAG: carboxymuconolactone decarboxylase family protein [Candidatus Binataceae bacterium]